MKMKDVRQRLGARIRTLRAERRLTQDALADRAFISGAYTSFLERGEKTASLEVLLRITEVLDVKTNHGRCFAVVRGGTHHFRLPASWGHSHPFTVIPVDDWPYPFPRPGVGNTPVTVAGELCSPKDILARAVPVRSLRAGDVVWFHHAGAYGWAISHHDFLSHPHPRQVFLRGRGRAGESGLRREPLRA